MGWLGFAVIVIGILWFKKTSSKAKNAMKDPAVFKQYVKSKNYSVAEQKDLCERFGLDYDEVSTPISNHPEAKKPTEPTPPINKTFPNRVKHHPSNTFDVHFTGFKKTEKAILIELAESKEMVVRKDVTKYLNLLCYGYNASQRKLDLARQQGVIILKEPEFKHFVETGEIP
ncbi:hypothetical protein [Vibrio algicola]|uniref:BRCT domain-containing protein n=1 Tax=Vibrio algicola TaxID=2662262 RepID=A0A5Q0TF10_9VIBR|nr:hypothetical protein [Vibrio algicola]